MSATQQMNPTAASSIWMNRFFASGAGGYADHIFRRAALELFGVDLYRNKETLWLPVVASTESSVKQKVSARTAQRRREYYEATLVCCRTTGMCRLRQCDDDDKTTNTDVVLRFAIAYGMQTVQTAIFQERHRFDYVEAMACPNGACLNGGGQIRVSDREAPTETRQRVEATRQRFVAQDTDTIRNKTQMMPLHTRYHVVPVMQHTLGAAAGVSVQDTQW